MYAPLYETIKSNAGVKAVLGNSPRVYPHGRSPAPSDPLYALPYAVFQMINGLAENYLDKVPDADDFTVQIDVYGSTVDSATNGARALRDAIEPVAYVARWGGQFKDPDTNLFRYSFDVDWITLR